MKKLVAAVLTAIMIVTSLAFAAFGEVEITVLTNDAEDAFDITFTCFDDAQVLIGTVENGTCVVSFDKSGFMGRDCQQIWEDALDSENP